MRVKVPVHTFGEPSGVKQQGGVFEVVTREVEIECLPADIPTEFSVDVSGLVLGKQLRANELPLDKAKMKLITEPERVLAHVVTLRSKKKSPPKLWPRMRQRPPNPKSSRRARKKWKAKKAPRPKPNPRPRRAKRKRSGKL